MNRRPNTPENHPLSDFTLADVKSSHEYIVSQVITDKLTDFKPGSVLDIGAGSGRNVHFLARKGFDVTAVETDPVAIKKLSELQKQAADTEDAGKIEVIHADISNLDLSGAEYDNVIAMNSLRFLRRKRSLGAIAMIQSVTRSGGLNILQDLTRNGPLYSRFSRQHWQTSGELRSHYDNQGWDVLSVSSEVKPTKDQDWYGKPLWHESATVVARKP